MCEQQKHMELTEHSSWNSTQVTNGREKNYYIFVDGLSYLNLIGARTDIDSKMLPKLVSVSWNHSLWVKRGQLASVT